MRCGRLAVASLALLIALAWSWGAEDRTLPTGEALRAEFRQLVMGNRQVVPLAPRLIRQGEEMGLREERVRLTPEAGEEAIAVVLRTPRPGRRPVVIVQHFLGSHKDDMPIRLLLRQIAGQGYLAVAIDGRYRGERQRGKTLYDAIAEALRTGRGHPWLLDTVYDLLRLVDYVVTRDDADPEQIGILGLSEGGMAAWMAAVCDDRLKVVIPMLGVTRFADLIANAASPAAQETVAPLRKALTDFAQQLGEPEVNETVWRAAWERLIPGCCDRFEATRLVPLIAPRPMLILAHERDELIPLAGTQAVFEAARERYRALGAEDRLQMRVAPGLKHAATDLTEILLIAQFLTRWLPRPGAAAAASRSLPTIPAFASR